MKALIKNSVIFLHYVNFSLYLQESFKEFYEENRRNGRSPDNTI